MPSSFRDILTTKNRKMTYQQVIKTLQKIALTQHNVRYTGYGDLYRDLSSNPNIKYDVVYITPNQHQTEEEIGFDRYNLNLIYISRLDNVDGDNTLQVQSVGKEILTNIIRIFCEEYDSEVYGQIVWQMFTQRFGDLCGGCYCMVQLEVPQETICIDD